jgi:uncharacterized membrane protein YkvA (DUF1232 family)
MWLMAFYEKLKKRARSLKVGIGVLFLALRDPRTPWYAKGLAVVIVGYALSPIDLIPDFVPVLGYLDDLLLLPLGIYLTMKLIPQEVLVECRLKTAENSIEVPFRKSWIAGCGVVLIWLLLGWIIYCRIR